jgi:hypothetical protein
MIVHVQKTLKRFIQKQCPRMDSRNDQSTMPSEIIESVIIESANIGVAG